MAGAKPKILLTRQAACGGFMHRTAETAASVNFIRPIRRCVYGGAVSVGETSPTRRNFSRRQSHRSMNAGTRPNRIGAMRRSRSPRRLGTASPYPGTREVDVVGRRGYGLAEEKPHGSPCAQGGRTASGQAYMAVSSIGSKTGAPIVRRKFIRHPLVGPSTGTGTDNHPQRGATDRFCGS